MNKCIGLTMGIGLGMNSVLLSNGNGLGGLEGNSYSETVFSQHSNNLS